MSNYSKMDASPFWKMVMRITGILCLVTLMLPTVYYLKYVAVDYPAEIALAKEPVAAPLATEPAAEIARIQQYIHVAVKSPKPAERTWAVRSLAALVALPHAQVLHPMECLNAKLTLGSVASHDPDPAVKQVAMAEYGKIAQHGIVLQR